MERPRSSRGSPIGPLNSRSAPGAGRTCRPEGATAALGARLAAEVPHGEAAVTVVKKPFVDPEKEIPKS